MTSRRGGRPGTKQPVSAWVGQGSANAFAAPVGDYRRPAGKGWNQSSSKEYGNKYDQPAVIPPPLKHGWQWRSNMSQAAKVGNVSASNPANATDDKDEIKYTDEEDSDTEDIYDSDEDDNGKWVGMGSNELLEYFTGYEAMKARHSYGPQGHRGMSVLIFEASAVGFFEADRLSKRFEDEGTNRDAWDHQAPRFLPGGQRLLYGYMADKGDINIFNQHSRGKPLVKFEMKSYEEMVVNSIRQMSEDNHLLNWYKNIAVKEKKYAKTLEDSFGSVSEKLRKTQEENRIVRLRTKQQVEQHKEEMDSQEEFYKEQLKHIHEARNEREENFEKRQQEAREKMKISMENPSSAEERQLRFQQGATSILSQQEAMDNFADERDKLVNGLADRKAALMRRRFEEDVKLEKEFDEELARLMEKYNHTSLDEERQICPEESRGWKIVPAELDIS
ncbi:XS domain-containing protein [Heracleum sosnowskyi]|uniref:XS domain-containing protein n=1 Tax=Heracleum sosnowskyi TaxID=360622 RepID=A0AAD8H8J5_9APIA|nr:XS domain-containing protein [Heracleum sosnowskyi]